MDLLKFAPAVFAVGDSYQIMAVAKEEATFWVKVGDRTFYDHSNGILRSACYAHRVNVPKKLLDEAGEYTVCMRKIIERSTYFPKLEDEVSKTYSFKAVSGNRTLAYHIADSHNLTEEPVAATKTFEKEYGKIDFLILNGDVPEDSGSVDNFDNVYKIISDITAGGIPVVFSRGNHDMRGIKAETFAENTPSHNGKTYYNFRFGNIWVIVMDSVEDKADDSIEYGGTICCHSFRLEETDFLEDVIANSNLHYASDGIKHKIVIAHNPFTAKKSADIFDIEKELFTKWGRLLRENVEPEVMICGHKHSMYVDMPGSELDSYGHPCPVVVGSFLDIKKKHYAGTGFVFDDDGVEVVFTDNYGKITDKTKI
ncbi:MAG: metallophosphoesterase [Clostridia bacterium]|nr:metallophosphoesterase [Clostridia bacterium]